MHPALYLALWFWLALLLASLERHFLFLASASLLLLGVCLIRQRLWRACLRMRWLLLAVVLVYGWTTPGWYLWAGLFAPTREGLLFGIDQVLRLLALICGLQFLLTRLDRDGIFAGLYCLLLPLRFVGVERERLAVRLALTIAFADELLEKQTGFQELLAHLRVGGSGAGADCIFIPVQPMVLRDRILLFLLVSGMILGVIFLGNHSWP